VATLGTATSKSLAAAANSAPSPDAGCGLPGTLVNSETVVLKYRRREERVEERMKYIFIEVCVSYNAVGLIRISTDFCGKKTYNLL
jgi:hypothetical protein